MKKYKVLFVCLGNICRSPAAEGILSDLVKEKGLGDQIEIDSAGTSGYHDGGLPDSRMRKHGAMRGYDFTSRSRKFTQKDFYDFDMIITMDDHNFEDVMDLSPDLDSQKKVHKMVEFLYKAHYDHIPDPYYLGSDGFELVLDLLEDGCGQLLSVIENKIDK